MSTTQRIINELTSVYPEGLTLDQFIQRTALKKDVVELALSELINQKYPISINGDKFGLTFPLLSPAAIAPLSKTQFIGKRIRLFPSLESTNNYAKENLASLENGEVILAHEQTSGKGRLGRSWSSPIGKSISMSIVLKPAIQPENISLLTQLSAAALVDALKEMNDVKIKWPNDLIMNRKKMAGILIETEFSGGTLKGIIIGIGINTNLESSDIPDGLQSIATSIKEQTKKVVNPNTLLARFFISFEHYYKPFVSTHLTEPFLSVCRDHSILIGNNYWVINDTEKRKAYINDISPSGGLVVTYHDTNQTAVITSTHLSIRGDAEYI